ncbi:hypothetical protein JCM11491_001715 [Sporobolomyces phaffii]
MDPATAATVGSSRDSDRDPHTASEVGDFRTTRPREEDEDGRVDMIPSDQSVGIERDARLEGSPPSQAARGQALLDPADPPSTRMETLYRQPASPSSAPVLPIGAKRKRRFSRSISHLSLSSLASLSRPNTSIGTTPSIFPEDRNPFDPTSPPRSVKSAGKAKLREFFRLDSNKILAPVSRPSSPSNSQQDLRPSVLSPSLERVRSRGRSHSAPSIFPGSQAVGSISARFADSPPATPPVDSTVDTPFHSAVSSPLSSCFSFCPELNSTPKDTFSSYLPVELQIQVMKALLEVCQEDWRREVKDGTWKGVKARERWSDGEARGRRELARVGRVSRAWRRLSLDGQLWRTGPATISVGSDSLTIESVVSLFEESGSYVTKLDLQGFGQSLDRKMFDKVVSGASTSGRTNLTSVNLRGCASLPSCSITSLIACSPDLDRVDLFGLAQIDSAHIDLLSTCCVRLAILNVSRCRNLPASSLLALCIHRPGPTTLKLKRIAASALTGMSNEVVVAIFTENPELESVDISFSPHLTDDAFRRIVTRERSDASLTVEQGSTLTSPAPTHPSMQPRHPASRASSASTDTLARFLPALKHLNLSGCTLLTSRSLSHLTDRVPALLHLELSRLSPAFDAASDLAPFLASVRATLVNLDLEDGIDLGDDVLAALVGSGSDATPSPLETLILNGCARRVTDGAIRAVIEGSRQLRVLELDGTAVSDETAREFVRRVRERQTQARVDDDEPEDARAAVPPPRVLSILDNRLTGRRLHREVGEGTVRPRIGYRGYWTRAAVGFYHDGDESDDDRDGDDAGRRSTSRRAALRECDPKRVVVRSFYSSLEVDAANAYRRARDECSSETAAKGGAGGSRIRAMSDSVLLANGGRRTAAEASLSTSSGCTVM